MTNNDIDLIVAALRVARHFIDEKEPKAKRAALNEGVSHAANFLAVMLSDCHKRFDPERFLVACGNALDDDGRPILHFPRPRGRAVPKLQSLKPGFNTGIVRPSKGTKQ